MINRTRSSMHQDSVAFLLNPQSKMSSTSINHLIKNKNHLRQLQQSQMTKLQDQQNQTVSVFKMKKFQNVESKLKNIIDVNVEDKKIISMETSQKRHRSNQQRPLTIEGTGNFPRKSRFDKNQKVLNSSFRDLKNENINIQNIRQKSLEKENNLKLPEIVKKQKIITAPQTEREPLKQVSSLNKEMLQSLNFFNKNKNANGEKQYFSKENQIQQKKLTRSRINLQPLNSDQNKVQNQEPVQIVQKAIIFPKKEKKVQFQNQFSQLQNEKKEEIKEDNQAKQQKINGTIQMPEDERLQILQDLQANKKRVTDLLNKMPISMQTLSVRQKKAQLEEKLLEIDKSICILSNKNIYIKE